MRDSAGLEDPAVAKGQKAKGNVYNWQELAGAFGDLGTLIPFVVVYLTILHLNPMGVLLAFGLSKIVSGLYYRTPVPVQPMKVIGMSAVTQASITPGAVYGAGLVTGLAWLVLGLTGTITYITRLARPPVVKGIVLGLGLLFILDGAEMMATNFWLAVPGALLAVGLFTYRKFPAMFGLLALGAGAAFVQEPGLLSEIRFGFTLPTFAVASISWSDLATGTILLALPQLPLTLGNAVISTTLENNELFPDRKVTERKLSISTGIMNLLSPLIGGVPMCHGAGGMAGHVKFGARTGGALVMLGVLMLVIALFFSQSVELIFRIFPTAILGVILFFAGAELSLAAKPDFDNRHDFYVMIITTGLAMWNIGAAFIVGILAYYGMRRWARP
ncbi:MAG: putative sulfate/molybdate transporter [Chloroflexota bacterium]|nr:putative sulfate/molybdate transporter [Chloroflexota bacterium]